MENAAIFKTHSWCYVDRYEYPAKDQENENRLDIKQITIQLSPFHSSQIT